MADDARPNGIPRKLRDAWLAKLRDPDTTQLFGEYFFYNFPLTGDVRGDCGCAMGLLYICLADIYGGKPPRYAGFDGQYNACSVYIDGIRCDVCTSVGEYELHANITMLNDSGLYKLPQIADWIEQHVPVLDTGA